MRSGNSNTHPGMVDISIEEEGVDLLPNTPAPKKRQARNRKEKMSAKEVEDGVSAILTERCWSDFFHPRSLDQ